MKPKHIQSWITRLHAFQYSHQSKKECDKNTTDSKSNQKNSQTHRLRFLFSSSHLPASEKIHKFCGLETTDTF